MSETCFRVNAPAVIHEKFDDELVAINLDTGVYHSLSGAAADAFQLLTEEATLTEVAEALAGKYAADMEAIRTALTSFFEQLRKEKLICQVDSRKPRGPLQLEGAGSNVPLGIPALEAYRDLQSLFLLDPVHEVGEEGWPNPAPGSPEA